MYSQVYALINIVIMTGLLKAHSLRGAKLPKAHSQQGTKLIILTS